MSGHGALLVRVVMPIDVGWLQQQFQDLQELQILAQGGQKYVFSARHAKDGDVVLKLINPHQDSELVRREILAVVQVEASSFCALRGFRILPGLLLSHSPIPSGQSVVILFCSTLGVQSSRQTYA